MRCGAYMFKDFKYLDDLIHSGVKDIVLDGHVRLDDSEKRKYSDGIEIDIDDIAIHGNGFTIYGNESARIFNITAKNVTLENIAFMDGLSKEEGGAISNSGEVRIIECEFRNNRSFSKSRFSGEKFTQGGAIFNVGRIYIKDCRFYSSYARRGGAIFNGSETSLLEIDNTIFKDNDSSYDGEVIVNQGQLKITNCEFDGNKCLAVSNIDNGNLNMIDTTVADSHAAIFNTSKSNIEKCKFTNNELKVNGTISNRRGHITISDSEITDNSTSKKINGGAVTNRERGVIKIINTLIRNNHANNGGAISNRMGGIIEIADSTIDGNSADDKAGSIFNEDDSIIKAEKTIISNNSSAKNIIYNSGLIEFRETTFKENTQGGSWSSLPVLIDNDGKINIKNSLIEGHDTKLGGLLINNEGSIDIDDTSIKDNDSRRLIMNSGNMNLTDLELSNNVLEKGIDNNGEIDIKGCTIESNKSLNYAIRNEGKIRFIGTNIIKNAMLPNETDHSEAMISNEGEMELSGITFSENESDAMPMIINSNRITVNESFFIKNKCKLIENNRFIKFNGCEFNGASIDSDLISNGDTLIINGSKFEENAARALISNDATLSLIGANIASNTTAVSAIVNNGTDSTIEASNFEKNASSKKYSADILNNNELKIQNSSVKGDEKTINTDNGTLIIKGMPDGFEKHVHGLKKRKRKIKGNDFYYLDGLIHSSGNKKIILKHDIALQNYEKEFYEGGIDLDIDGLEIDGNNKSIDANSLSRIFIVTAKNVTLKNIIFKNGHNHKNYENPVSGGGCIQVSSSGTIKIENCRFIDNTSKNWGGAILNYGESSINETQFHNNDAADCGGVIYNYKKMHLNRNTFDNNSSQNSGGAVYNKGELDITETLFDKNESSQGGAIANMMKMSVRNSEFIDNRTDSAEISSHGGAIDNQDFMELFDCRFEANGSANGGGINNAGELKIQGGEFTANTSKNEGGSVCNTGKLKVQGSEFTKNTSENEGGSITNRGVLEIYESTLTRSTSKNGGVISNEGFLEIYDSKFCENDADNHGGVINFIDGDGLIDNSIFNDNSSKDGGCIYVGGYEVFSIAGSRFSGNYAYNGGAIYGGGEGFKIENTIFENNEATYGGSIYVKSKNPETSKCTFTKNHAKEDGNDIFNHERSKSKIKKLFGKLF